MADMLEEVSFRSGEITVAGHLRRPTDRRPPYAALVFTGPFTGVKEQVTGTYAAALAIRGYLTLAFDHRNFGASEGGPRQHEDVAGKLADLCDATSFLATHPDVDEQRIGCVGVCLGASCALRHSAFDPRISAVAVVAGAYNDPAEMRARKGAGGYREAMAAFAAVAERQFVGAELDYLPAVAPDGDEAAMPGDEPWRYYGTERSASPGWVNRVTRLSLRELLTFDAATAADFLAHTPALVVHGTVDDYCPPDGARRVHERIAGTSHLVWLETTEHIDLYDNATVVDAAVQHVAGFFDNQLVGGF
jgi:uncharacterized protein